MSFSDVSAQAVAPAPAQVTAPAPQAQPTTTKEVRKMGKIQTPEQQAKAARLNDFKVQGESARNAVQEADKAKEGSKSDKIEFLAVLFNPKKPQKRVQGNKQIDSYVVAGYRFKVLEATKVPHAPYLDNTMMKIDTESVTWETVPAGTIINLNLMETTLLISQYEYAGVFSGGTRPVQLGATATTNQSLMENTTTNGFKPQLNLISKEGSIKDGASDYIADLQGDKYVVKPEYAASFDKLFVHKVRSDKKNASRGNGEPAKNLAAAFNKLFQSKGVVVE